MGINISLIHRETRRDHPDWDFSRYSGDRHLVHVLHDTPGLVTRDDGDAMRPTDWDSILSTMIQDYPVNEERWRHLVALLRDDPSYWIEIH